MAKKIIFVSILSFLLFFPLSNFGLAAAKTCSTNAECPKGQLCREEKCGRPLEIIYPQIPGVPGAVVPETTATGLPDYVKYIFLLSVILIGFVIFGVLIYSGIKYLTSTGDPAKMSDAKEGIFSALLGAVILLSAYLIFHTINPQLTILTLPETPPLEAVVTPGAYVCSYKADNIEDVLNRYIEKRGEEEIKAAEELKKIMNDPTDKNRKCQRVNSSTNLDFMVGPDNTIFIVPTIILVPDESNPPFVKRKPIYEYGMVLHAEDDFKGQCDYFPKEDPDNLLYTVVTNEGGVLQIGDDTHQITGHKSGSEFSAQSVTVFKKLSKEIASNETAGVTLYSCLDYNEIGCPDGVAQSQWLLEADPYTSDIRKVTQTGFSASLVKNVRSVSIKPKGSYFALFFDGVKADGTIEDFKGNCAIVKTNDPDIGKMPLKKCNLAGEECTQNWLLNVYYTFIHRECIPCITSTIVIKGMTL